MKWGDIALQNAERNPDVTIAGEHRRATQRGNTVHLANGSKRGNKYNARPHTLDNIVFASGAEARAYAELQLRQAAGEISDVDPHPPSFELIPAFTDAHGEDVRPATYTADFAYTDADGCRVIVDVKGGNATQTRDFMLRWKMLRYMHRHDSGVRFEIWER